MNDTIQDAGASFWLVIESESERKVFVFRPEDDHTIVVGSDPAAHFRLKGSAALCFFVERIEGRLQLVPGYVDNLRLNSHQVTERVALRQNGVVEFGKVRLNLTVQDVPPHEDDVTVFLPVSTPGSGRTAEERYDEAMATRVAEVAHPSDVDDLPTTATNAPKRTPETNSTPAIEFAQTEEVPGPHVEHVEHVESRPLERAPSRRPALEDDHPALATQIVGSFRAVDEPLTHGTGSMVADIGTDRTEGIPFQDFVPSTGKSKAVRIEGRLDPPNGRSNETAPAVRRSEPEREAPRSMNYASVSLRNSLSRLGNWVQDRPVFAIGGGVTGALILGLAIGGVSRMQSLPPSPPPTSFVAPRVQNTPSAPREYAGNERSKDKLALGAPSKVHEVSPSPEEVKQEAEVRAAEEKAHADEVNRAVEHLVAGRDVEAARAYQSIAQTKHASEQLKRMSELMQRRTNAQHNQKPAASQVPELYR